MQARGATTLAEGGTLPPLIQVARRWTSDTFNHYVRKSPFLFKALLTGWAPSTRQFTCWPPLMWPAMAFVQFPSSSTHFHYAPSPSCYKPPGSKLKNIPPFPFPFSLLASLVLNQTTWAPLSSQLGESLCLLISVSISARIKLCESWLVELRGYFFTSLIGTCATSVSALCHHRVTCSLPMAESLF